MATPFSLSGLLVYPPDDGQPNASRDLSGSGSFSSKVEAELNLVAPGTTVVGMGTIANARVVLVEVGVLASITIGISCPPNVICKFESDAAQKRSDAASEGT